MSADNEYWSIDFLGVDEYRAETIIAEVQRLGLATSAITADSGTEVEQWQ